MKIKPSLIIQKLSQISPDVLYYMKTNKPVVALTIDDAPSSNGTKDILNVLKKHQATATFFVITSYISRNEKVVEKIIDNGHEIGNHMVVDSPAVFLHPTKFEEQLYQSHEVLSEYSNIKWFRPGSGLYKRSMIKTLKKYNYRCVLGSVYPFDPQLPFESYIQNYILKRVFPGAIIILHDYDSRGPRTARVLDKVLPVLKERGYEFVSLTKLVHC